MNKLAGRIVFIESSAQMSIVDVKIKGDIFSAVLLDVPGNCLYLKIGQPVEILFKETEVSVAKNLSGEISLRNRVRSPVKRVNSQGILTEVVFDYKGADISSIISTRSALRLKIKEGEEAEAEAPAQEGKK